MCKDCRKKEIEPTFREKILLFLINTLFGETISDIKADSFTKGFGSGYKEGFQQAKDIGDRECNNIIKLYDRN